MTLELISNELTETSIRILKEDSCPSLSERSTLTYHIGCNENNDILFRINGNSGTGKFNREWVPVADMLELIYEAKKPFSWKVLYPLVVGKSVNTACFLMAALKQEGLLVPLDRLYQQSSSAEFQDRMKELMDKKGTTKAAAKRPRKKKEAKQ
jgi:hypothetical protein